MTDAPAPGPTPIHVLIMDDSRSARFAIGKFLESLGCTVDSVDDLTAALSYLDRRRPDLLFLDHDVDDTGFQALHTVKLHAAGAAMPVVLCLSDQLPGFDARAFAHGAAAVMIKPPLRDDLGALLSALMPGIQLTPRPALAAAADNVDPPNEDAPLVGPDFEPAAADTADATERDAGRLHGERVAPAFAEQAEDLRADIARVDTPPSSPPPAAVVTAAAPASVAAEEAAAASVDGSVEARLQQLESRLRALEQNVERGLMELRVQLDLRLQAQNERIDQSRDAIRAMAAEEAQVIAERTVMGAAAKISDRLAESILKTLGKT